MNTTASFLISAVVPTYNVAKYLPEFLASLDRQTIGIDAIDLVFVDDGSTDDSGRLLDEWARGRESHVTVLHQENQKLSAARNNGLARVRGAWVTFSDPDDVLDDGYFAEVTKFIQLHDIPELTVLGTHQMILDDLTGRLHDSHPLRKKFEKGSRIIDLSVEPTIQLSSCSAFLRVDVIRDLDLQFDGRVRPNFEDGHLISRLLLESGTHLLGIVASAKYHYRSRVDGSSLIQTSYRDPDKYTALLRYGHLDLLQRASRRGEVPRWLENVVLYDLYWYFRNERAIRSMSAAAPASAFDEFHALMKQIRALLTPDAIFDYDLVNIEFAVKETMLTGYLDEPLRPKYVKISAVDEQRQEVLLTYWFNGDLPAEEIIVDGRVVEPLHAKVQDYVYYGRVLLRRRHLWIPRGAVTTIATDGIRQSVVRYEQWDAPTRLTSKQMTPVILGQRRRVSRRFTDTASSVPALAKKTVSTWWKKRVAEVQTPVLYDNALSTALHTKKVRERFAHAWVFMDRDTSANDNAEHLYRHAMKHHPEINSWFVLKRSSGDWARLEAEGFRLVAHGSREWKLLLLSADHLASAQADHYVVRPLDARRYGGPRFRYTFLQHGVTKDDLSRWLNIKPIELFVTATPAEKESIAGDGPYQFTSKETVLTGFPRHDALLEKRRAIERSDQDLIVIMPTWRQTLLGAAVAGSNDRLKGDAFNESEYARLYADLLRDAGLKALAERTGKKLTFMPHPNMKPHLDDFDVPAYVDLLGFDDANVQDILARAAVVVSDYSSLAFEASFLDIPVVYFQFDADEFFNGLHIGRRGYFDYSRDGFGPVVDTVSEVVSAVETIASNDYELSPEYQERTRAAFVTRDTHSSERVIQAMKALEGGPRIEEPTVAPVAMAQKS